MERCELAKVLWYNCAEGISMSINIYAFYNDDNKFIRAEKVLLVTKGSVQYCVLPLGNTELDEATKNFWTTHTGLTGKQIEEVGCGK